MTDRHGSGVAVNLMMRVAAHTARMQCGDRICRAGLDLEVPVNVPPHLRQLVVVHMITCSVRPLADGC